MDILTFINNHTVQPSAWCQTGRIPWNEPGFSARLLKDHLAQSQSSSQDGAKRVVKQVQWIHQKVLGEHRTKVLDLGCGPGFYSFHLAALGHECVGIDFSPAEIAYASAYAADQEEIIQKRCTYHMQDIRQANFDSGFGLVMLVFGLFNIFHPDEARMILQKTYSALLPGGTLLLEPQTEQIIHQFGNNQLEWYVAKVGLFSEKPHLCLMESCWEPASSLATRRYYIIDGATGSLTCYTSNLQAYSQDAMQILLKSCGYDDISFYPSLSGKRDDTRKGLYVLTARKSS